MYKIELSKIDDLFGAIAQTQKLYIPVEIGRAHV